MSIIIGETVHPNTENVSYKTPWSPSNGDFGRFVAEIIDFHDSVVGALELRVQIQTKNTEDSDGSLGAGSIIGTATMTGLSIGTMEGAFSGALELVRFLFTLTGDKAADWAHIRPLNYSWATN